MYIFVHSITSTQYNDEDDEDDEDFEEQGQDQDDDPDETQDEEDDEDEAGSNESSGSESEDGSSKSGRQRGGGLSGRKDEQKRRRLFDSQPRSNFTMLPSNRYPHPTTFSSPPSSQSSSASSSSSSSSSPSSAGTQPSAGKIEAEAAHGAMLRPPSVEDAKRVLSPASDEKAYCWTHFSHPIDQAQRERFVRCNLCYEKNAQDPSFWIPFKKSSGTNQLWNHLLSHHFSQAEIDAMKKKRRFGRCVYVTSFLFSN